MRRRRRWKEWKDYSVITEHFDGFEVVLWRFIMRIVYVKRDRNELWRSVWHIFEVNESATIKEQNCLIIYSICAATSHVPCKVLRLEKKLKFLIWCAVSINGATRFHGELFIIDIANVSKQQRAASETWNAIFKCKKQICTVSCKRQNFNLLHHFDFHVSLEVLKNQLKVKYLPRGFFYWSESF